ncbi:hypothetical protein DPMN_109391 [Dreissena polymorpha]|uniref:Uncharacterized protein n=1 Tax=Dreissena polymorpha TaxID=45954 RepID=A0A9D4KAY3_DREPO|nr:hypothetical protein DPMN_134083 [Dreissena polymorpha]KAH3836022.1 hypothetical protein DPMN_109391 [Dreissena polymorpha]
MSFVLQRLHFRFSWAYLIVVIEVIGVFKASTLYVSGVPCSSGSGGNISGCIVAYTRWRVFSRVRVAV